MPTSSRFFDDVPVLTRLDPEVGVRHPHAIVVSTEASIPQEVAVCVFDTHGVPIDAQRMDLSRVHDQNAFLQMCRDAHSDRFSMLVVAGDMIHTGPLQSANDLLRRMIARYNTNQLPDNPFVRAWIEDAQKVQTNILDTQEWLLNAETLSSEPVDGDFLSDV